MRRPLMARLAEERGVALVTVVLVAAALTAVATAGSFMAIRQLRASGADWRGAQAESYAEAGLEKFLTDLKGGAWGINSILEAGCALPPVPLPQGLVGDGSYSAQLTVYNPNVSPPVPPEPYSAIHDDLGAQPTPSCQNRGGSTKVPQLYAITSTGITSAATAAPALGTTNVGRRAIRSVVSISGSGLPVGIFVKSIDANGSPDFDSVSVFASGDVIGREKLQFTGNDLYYTLADIYCSNGIKVNVTPATACPANYSMNIPAAVHATGAIYGKFNAKPSQVEHPPNPNCNANPRGTPGQSLWDGSGQGGNVTATCATWPPNGALVTFPPTSKFTAADVARIGGARPNLPQLTEPEYQNLKAQAQSSGIYCSIPTSGPANATCTKYGGSYSPCCSVGNTSISGLSNFVVYMEYAPGTSNNTVDWSATVGPCSSTPSMNKSVTVVVRNGNINFRGGGSLYGNVVTPEGVVDSAGNYVITGSVIAKSMRLRGTARFALDACAVANAPSSTINVSPGRWSEVDR